jgi:tyrosinase
MYDYYIADDVKELTSTFASGYYYLETPLEYVIDPVKMRQYATKQVNKLYGPPIKVPKKKLVENPPDMEAPAAPVQPTRNWQVFVRVKKFAIQGTWGIHVFLGELPVSSFNWYFAEARVGTVTILSNRNIANCGNCQNRAAGGQLVTGTVSLSDALTAKGLAVTDAEAVIQFLKETLTWKVVKV